MEVENSCQAQKFAVKDDLGDSTYNLSPKFQVLFIFNRLLFMQ